MSDVRQQVRLFVEQHSSDGLLYMDCPVCLKHNKLMIGTADEGGHFYKCLSANCGTFGTTDRVARIPNEGTPVPKTGRKLYRHYTEEAEWTAAGVPSLRYLADQFWLPSRQVAQLCNGRWCKRYVFPVYNTKGSERGYVMRGYSGEQPKTLIRPFHDVPVPMVSWYFPVARTTKYPAVAVVEDQVSAAKLGEFMPAVALLGTSIDYHAQREIETVASGLQAERICVILDNDAQNLAVTLAGKFAQGVAVPIFHEDVKDMDRDTFEQLVEVINGR